ncbi:MAG: hypothetical protein JNL11_00915 [Bdellovibrionaceae bacterium]|nr:hypothetical protein [Pseudobdellovibrionaceae bacterium]
MTFLLSIYALAIYAKILTTKFNKKTALIVSSLILLGFIITFTRGKSAPFYLFTFFISSTTLLFSMNQLWILKIKRKFYTVPAIIFQIPLLLSPLYKMQLNTRMCFLFFGFSFIIGLLLDQFLTSPQPFASFFEYAFYRSEKNKYRLHIPQMQNYLRNNLGNFVLGQLFIRKYIGASASEKIHYQKDLLPSLVIYWVSKKSFTSMHPMAKTFNQLDIADIKENFTFYDLSNMDLPWIHDVFRCGCWKIGLYLLDQYLLTNKQSSMYTASLLWSDRILNDLKRVSFDEESIETWLMDYRERFQGTPLSAKIQLVYHNKDDWFEKSYRFAAI